MESINELDTYVNIFNDFCPNILEKSRFNNVIEFSSAKEALIAFHYLGARLVTDDWYYSSESDRVPYLSRQIWDDNAVNVNRRYLKTEMIEKFHTNIQHFETSFKMRTAHVERKLSSERENIVDIGLDKDEVILHLIEKKSDPHFLDEHFWEYLAGNYFRDKGYLIHSPNWDYWTPHELGGRIPDVICIKDFEISQTLKKYGFIQQNGAFISELLHPRFFGLHPSPESEPYETHSIVIEAESQPSKLNAVAFKGEQLLIHPKNNAPGYLKCNCFDEGYAVGPDISQQRGRRKVGILSNIGNNLEELYCPKPRRRESFSHSTQKTSMLNQFKHFIKQILISNLSLEEMCVELDLNSKKSLYNLFEQIEDELKSKTLDDVAKLVITSVT